MDGSRLRVVLERRCLLLFDEGFGVRSTTQGPDWKSIGCGFKSGYLGLIWYKYDKTMGCDHGGLDVS